MKPFNIIAFILMTSIFMFSSCGDKEKADTSTLSPPTGLQIEYATGQYPYVFISFNTVSGADYYELYRSSSQNGNYEKRTDDSKISAYGTVGLCDYEPLNGWNYYKVKAVKESENSETRSDFSSSVSYEHIANDNDGNGGNGGGTGSLSVPAGVSASQNGSAISISWNSVSGATQYFVFRSSSSTGTYSSLTSVSGTSATDASPLSGYNYYKVKASNGTTTSDYSSYASVNYTSGGGGGGTTTAPTAPTGVSVANEGNSLIPMIAIRWNKVSNATSYKVYRSTSANGSYSQIGSSTTNNVLTDDNPREGTSYYKVKAINSAGESPFSDYASLTYKANDVAPCPVTYGNCTVSGTTITMRWSVPATNGCGTPTKAYLRVKNPTGTQYADVQTLSGTATSASFNYGMWIDSSGYVYVGIITENDKGTSGGVPKVYDTKNKKWIN